MSKTEVKIRFETKVFRPTEGGDWTFLRLPQVASDQLPTRSMTSVEGTLSGYAFQAYLQPDGAGGHWLKIEPELSAGAGFSAGDVIDIEITPMAVELEPEVPEDLRQALSASPGAQKVWLATTTIARRDWIAWMTSGKRAETRSIRLEKMIDMLANGKRRVCCFDRSGMYSKGFTCPTPASDD